MNRLETWLAGLVLALLAISIALLLSACAPAVGVASTLALSTASAIGGAGGILWLIGHRIRKGRR